MNPSVGYHYLGLPLTPAITAELIIELLAGCTEQRSSIVEIIRTEHIARGGGEVVNAERLVMRALNSLKKKGLCTNPALGHWRIGSTSTQDSTVTDIVSVSEPLIMPEPILPEASLTVGQGNQSVYLYFWPVYKREATSQGLNQWPCKIGRTERDANWRILSQVGTAFPEKPEVALLIKTDRAALLEKAIHSVLKHKEQWMQEAPGAEWFTTNPDEVLAVWNFLKHSDQ